MKTTELGLGLVFS